MEMINELIHGIPALTLRGIFDADASSEVRDFFKNFPPESLPYIIVNLANVDFIDSTGLSTRVVGMKRCRQQNGTLVLYGTQGPVKSIMKLTLLDKVFTIFETQEEAVAYVQNQLSVAG